MSDVSDAEVLFAVAALGASGVRIGGEKIEGEDLTALGRMLGVFSYKKEPTTNLEWNNVDALENSLMELAEQELLQELDEGEGYLLTDAARMRLIASIVSGDAERVEKARHAKPKGGRQ